MRIVLVKKINVNIMEIVKRVGYIMQNQLENVPVKKRKRISYNFLKDNLELTVQKARDVLYSFRQNYSENTSLWHVCRYLNISFMSCYNFFCNT